MGKFSQTNIRNTNQVTWMNRAQHRSGQSHCTTELRLRDYKDGGWWHVFLDWTFFTVLERPDTASPRSEIMGRKSFFPRKQFLKFVPRLHVQSTGRVMDHGSLECRQTGAHFKKSRKGLPQWFSATESACQCRRCRFDPWSRKIPRAVE